MSKNDKKLTVNVIPNLKCPNCGNRFYSDTHFNQLFECTNCGYKDKVINFENNSALFYNPLESIKGALVSRAKDLTLNTQDAWIYGIVYGWDNPEEIEGLKDLSEWNIKRLKYLHENFKILEEIAQKKWE